MVTFLNLFAGKTTRNKPMRPSQMTWHEVPCVYRRGHELNSESTGCRYCGLAYYRGVLEIGLAIRTSKRRARGLKTRKLLMKRDGDFCWWCGKPLTIENSTIDHVLPQKLGGTSRKNNLVICCRRCNNKKRDQHPLVWIAWLVSLTDDRIAEWQN